MSEFYIFILLILVITLFGKKNKSTNSSNLKNDSKPKDKEISEDKQLIINDKFSNYRNEWALEERAKLFSNDSIIDLLGVNSINSIRYSNLLDCYEWKFKRLKILVRDEFTCTDCHEKKINLHVHHTYYLQDAMPWEIDDSGLVSLCKNCHTRRHESENIYVYKKVGNQIKMAEYGNTRCYRCYGTGYLPQFNHVENGICFACLGDIIPNTIFSIRLFQISTAPELYDIRSIYQEGLDFLNNVSIDFYHNHIHGIINILGNVDYGLFLTSRESLIDNLDDSKLIDFLLSGNRLSRKEVEEEEDDLPF